MPSAIPAATIVEIQTTKGVVQSATVFINGTKARLDAAVAASLELGATAEQLAPVQVEVDALTTERTKLAEAIAANP